MKTFGLRRSYYRFSGQGDKLEVLVVDLGYPFPWEGGGKYDAG